MRLAQTPGPVQHVGAALGHGEDRHLDARLPRPHVQPALGSRSSPGRTAVRISDARDRPDLGRERTSHAQRSGRSPAHAAVTPPSASAAVATRPPICALVDGECRASEGKLLLDALEAVADQQAEPVVLNTHLATGVHRVAEPLEEFNDDCTVIRTVQADVEIVRCELVGKPLEHVAGVDVLVNLLYREGLTPVEHGVKVESENRVPERRLHRTTLCRVIAGRNRKEISQRPGHASVAFTLHLYGHLNA